jgi:hypothetical protein
VAAPLRRVGRRRKNTARPHRRLPTREHARHHHVLPMQRQLDMAAVSSMKIHRENDCQCDRRATGSEQQDVTDIMTSDALPFRHVGNNSGFLLSSLFKVIA